MFDTVRALLGAVLEAVLPADCLLCDGLLPWSQEGGVCPPCWERLPWRPRSRRPRPRSGLDGLVASIEYRDAARRLVHALKFDRFDRLGPPLGRIAAGHGRGLLASLPACDVVVPVPLHLTRRFVRGFNQAEFLARGVAVAAGLPCAPSLLSRVRRGRRQRGLTSRARRASLAGVFRAARGARGRSVLLVDDVVTTGATLEACATALRDAGARSVVAFAVAATERLGDGARRDASAPTSTRRGRG